jgi:hypothetical protein
MRRDTRCRPWTRHSTAQGPPTTHRTHLEHQQRAQGLPQVAEARRVNHAAATSYLQPQLGARRQQPHLHPACRGGLGGGAGMFS